MTIFAETKNERPSSSVFTAGRIFYLVDSIVYFSQVMTGTNISFLTKCYQLNDPTAEQLNDVLDTDGGSVPINGADVGVTLQESANGVLIFCSNGVWELAGPATGFKATEFSLRKITNAGCISAQAVVQVEGTYYYWSESKIHVIATNEFSVLAEKGLTDNTIESFYSDISLIGKQNSYGYYDSRNNKIEWFYNDIADNTGTDLTRSHPSGLTYNLKTSGWFPHEFNGKVVENTTVTTSLIGGVDLSAIRDDGPFYISFEQGINTYTVKTGQRDDITFQDFGSNFSTAYLETGYETLAKPSNSKRTNYVTTHFKQTEENWIADGLGGFELDKQSGCQMRVQWDWNDTSANGRFSPFQQIYRFRRIFVPTMVEPFDSGETVITTKNKTLGRGKAVSLRFEQEDNKDFQLLGYTHQWSIKSRM